MSKNFEDILNEKIGKHQSPSKPESLEQNTSHYQTNPEIDPQFLRQLKNKLQIEISLKNTYNLAQTDFVPLKEESTPKVQDLETGFFEKSDAVVFALLFVRNLNLDIKDGVSKKAMKRIFRKMLLKHHPDTSQSAMDTESFTQMIEQFKILEKAWRPYQKAA